MFGLYGDLPTAKDEKAGAEENKETPRKEGWAGSGLMAPATLSAKRKSERDGRLGQAAALPRGRVAQLC